MRPTVTTRTLIAGVSATIMIAAGACSPSDDSDEAVSGDGLSVRNCDVDVDLTPRPERIYAAYQPAMEIAFALDQGDRLIGGGYPDAELLFEYGGADLVDDVDVTATLPGRDALLAGQPDFVLSGYNNVFTAEGDGSSFGDRASLAELDVRSWILGPLCPSADGLSDEAIDPATVTVETIHDDLRDLGALFDAEDEAEEIIADQNRRLAAVAERVEGLETPSVAILLLDDDGGIRAAGGIDFGTRVIEAAGGENVFADLTARRHVEIDVEELIARDPDVILTDTCCEPGMTEADGEPKVRSILDDPALAGMSAVRAERVHPFLFANRAAGIRAAHAAERLAELLHGSAS